MLAARFGEVLRENKVNLDSKRREADKLNIDQPGFHPSIA